MILTHVFRCEACGQLRLNYCRCTSETITYEQSAQKALSSQTALFHALWHELHSTIRTKEQFANWVKRVPSIGCECSSWLAKYLQDNPPTEDLREYGWTLHNAVSRKLLKAEMSWAEFCEKYPQE